MIERSTASLVVKTTVVGSLLLGLSGLAAYLPGLGLLGSVRPGYIPMAPSTSVSFILLAISILAYERDNEPDWIQASITIAITLVSLFGFLELLGFYLDMDLNYEDSLVPHVGTLDGVPIARMSPSTGALFCIAGISLLCFPANKKKSVSTSFRSQAAGLLSSIVLLSAITFLLGYIYGNPLLYDKKTVPMALTTAMGFCFIGIGIVTIVGTDYFPLNQFYGKATKARLMRTFLPMLLFAVIAQGFLRHLTVTYEEMNDALVVAILAVIYTSFFGYAINRMSISIGGKIDAAAKKLQSSEERLQAVVAKAPVPMSIVRLNGDIEYINEAFSKSLGYTIEDIRTLDAWWELAYPDSEYSQKMQRTWRQTVQEAQSSGKEIKPQTRELRRKDGNLRTIEYKLVPLGEIIIITMLDFTDHIQLVEALTKGEARLAEAQRLAHLGAWEWDIVNDTIWWSDEVYRIFDLPSSTEIKYETFIQAVHPEDRHHVETSVKQALKNKAHYNIEHRIILPDGTIKTVHERGNVMFDESDRPMFIVGTAQDVTERNLLEKQLIQATKMESIGQLAAGVAHEINTPAQFLKHNIHFFQESFRNITLLLHDYEKLVEATASDTKLTEVNAAIRQRYDDIDCKYIISELPKAIEESQWGLDRISRIVQSVKMFAHSNLSAKVPVDINNLIESVITVSTNEWKYHSDIHMDLDKNAPLVNCIPDQINQALLNLIINAAHANRSKVQQAELKKVGIFVTSSVEGKDIVITIRDEGVGIPDDIHDNIFDLFFTTKELGVGSGQGLAIVRRAIVDGHGGSIDFETQMGEGTKFTMRLPINND